MIVLSLFDGIACGSLALERIGIKPEMYFASEIEPYAMKVAKKNYPDIVELGDVRKVRYEGGILFAADGTPFIVGKIDLVIGGSPCTNFSSVGYANGMTTGNVEVTSFEQYVALKESGAKFEGQSFLFWEYVRMLREVKPEHFLLENVVMAKKWEKIITDAVGVEPVKINSSLLSAQNRPRLYWTNVPEVSVPKDAGIKLDDILDPKADDKDVAYTLTVQRCWPRLIEKYGYVPERFNAYNAAKLTDKACALSRGSMVTSSCATLLFVPRADGVHEVKDGMLDGKWQTELKDGRYNLRKLTILECERLQTLPDGYTDGVDVPPQKRNEMIGNGWTAKVIEHLFKGLK